VNQIIIIIVIIVVSGSGCGGDDECGTEKKLLKSYLFSTTGVLH